MECDLKYLNLQANIGSLQLNIYIYISTNPFSLHAALLHPHEYFSRSTPAALLKQLISFFLKCLLV